VHPFQKIPHQRHDLVESHFQEPVPAIEQMQFGIGQVPQIA